MSLLKRPRTSVATPCTNKSTHDTIKRLRYVILVHSLLYYELDTNLISDSEWTAFALQLVKEQKEHPDIAAAVIFSEAFKDFDGTTGFDLPYRDEQIIKIGFRLLTIDSEVTSKDISNLVNKLRSIKPTHAIYDGFYKNVKPGTVKRSTRRRVSGEVEAHEKTKKRLF